MATDTLSASMPPERITPGMTVRFEAISPTTGAAVSGVNITDVAIYAVDQGADASEPVAPFALILGPGG